MIRLNDFIWDDVEEKGEREKVEKKHGLKLSQEQFCSLWVCRAFVLLILQIKSCDARYRPVALGPFLTLFVLSVFLSFFITAA